MSIAEKPSKQLSMVPAVSVIALFIWTAVFGLLSTDYPGAVLPPILLATASTWCLCIAISCPSLSFFVALTFFLVMGFTIKFFVHQGLSIDYIEPIGAFSGAAREWDAALLAASAGMLGSAVAGSLWLLTMPAPPRVDPVFARSELYKKIEWPLALTSITIAIAIFSINWKFVIYRIGMEPLIILPGPLHAIFSFLVLWGIALWAGCMTYWAWSASRLPMWAAVSVGLFEGCIAGVSSLSRSRCAFHAMGFVLGWLATAVHAPRARFTAKQTTMMLALAILLGAASLLVVSIDRTISYRPPTDQQQPYSVYVSQISKLFIDRWIGMEGVMTVAATEQKGADLFWKGILESPNARSAGLYERMSNSQYQHQATMTFTTTAGGIAVLYYSGSYAVVLFGMFFLTLMGLALERAALLLTASPFASAVVAVSTANLICQVNQPYLSAVLAVELFTACLAVWSFRKAIGAFIPS